jgi:hypothetical protein
MLVHLAVTGDSKQHKQWRDRVEAIAQADAVDAARDPETKALLADKHAWEQMRATGKFGANFGLALGALWMSVLMPLYAVAHGFGWLASMAFVLPVPMAWRFGRKLWERAAVKGMRDLGKHPSLRKRMRTAVRSVARSFGAGFGFGFALVFTQALITWFMTPAPTLILELLIDARDGFWAGIITGFFSMLLAPLVGRQAPSNEEERALVTYEP